jgi:hypothetical protein
MQATVDHAAATSEGLPHTLAIPRPTWWQPPRPQTRYRKTVPASPTGVPSQIQLYNSATHPFCQPTRCIKDTQRKLAKRLGGREQVGAVPTTGLKKKKFPNNRFCRRAKGGCAHDQRRHRGGWRVPRFLYNTREGASQLVGRHEVNNSNSPKKRPHPEGKT